ncbi:Phosphatidylserine decarboxylase-related [Dillenia turbinata]|uniref:Phosphatidylserine decarboxylase-related n=1 Tax=Dillenia turbinata TaxID=194707 RepID=A0AAN8UT13_9MAGN
MQMFNEFFIRELKPGTWPIACFERDDVTIYAADSHLMAFKSIDDSLRFCPCPSTPCPHQFLILVLSQIDGSVNSVAVNNTYCNVFAENKRVVSSTKDFGKVAFVAIGATMVGSISFSKNEGDYAQKGDEVTIHIFKIVVVFKSTVVMVNYLEEQDVSGPHPLVDLIALNLATCTPD